MEERFKLDLLQQLQYSLSKEDLMLVEGAITFLFQQYSIGLKKNELIVCEGQNEKIITQFLAVKKLEGVQQLKITYKKL